MRKISAVLASVASIMGRPPLGISAWSPSPIRSTWKPPRKPTGTHKQNRRKAMKGRK